MIMSMIMALCTMSYSIVFATSTILGDDADVRANLGEGKEVTTMTNSVNIVLSYIQYIGYAISVGMLLYIGIKYTMSAANERAELKKGAINWIIGAIMIAGMTTIVTALMSISGSMSGTSQTGNNVNVSSGGLKKYTNVSDVEKNILKNEWQSVNSSYPDMDYNTWLETEKGIDAYH